MGIARVSFSRLYQPGDLRDLKEISGGDGGFQRMVGRRRVLSEYISEFCVFRKSPDAAERLKYPSIGESSFDCSRFPALEFFFFVAPPSLFHQTRFDKLGGPALPLRFRKGEGILNQFPKNRPLIPRLRNSPPGAKNAEQCSPNDSRAPDESRATSSIARH